MANRTGAEVNQWLTRKSAKIFVTSICHLTLKLALSSAQNPWVENQVGVIIVYNITILDQNPTSKIKLFSSKMVPLTIPEVHYLFVDDT